MDVNEKIVDSWLNYKQFFTINSIIYGQFHNDIDILAVNINLREVWDCEVKVRTGSTQISNNDNKTNGFHNFVKNFTDKSRVDAIKRHVKSDTFELKRKFITTKSLFGKTKNNQDKWVKKFQDEKIDVTFFDEVIFDLYDYAKKSKISTDEIIQVLRLFDIYKDSLV